MRREYDFSKARRNPYASRLKQSVTMLKHDPLDRSTVPIRLRALLVLLVIANLFSPACSEPRTQPQAEAGRDSLPPLDSIPPIGARVRVVVPQLGAGWRVGMFNRTRQEPPCYLVLLPDTGSIRRIAVIIPIRAATHLQVRRLYAGDIPEPDPSASSVAKETWRDVRLERLQGTGRNCPDSIRTG